MLLLNFIIAFAIFFPIVIVSITLIRNERFDFLLLFALLSTFFLTSCSKDELPTNLCGDCSVRFEVPFEKDSNGYYHANLTFNDAGAARFDIKAYASTIDDKSLWENDTPNFYSIFSGNIELTNDVGVVQHSRLQHDRNGYTKRVVGPVLTEHIGDTLIVSVDTHWVYAPLWENKQNTLKIIIE